MVNGNAGDFHVEVDFLRSGNIDSFNAARGDVFFQVTENSSFSFDGMYGLQGSGRIGFVPRVRDLTVSGGSSGIVYLNQQLSNHTLNQQFNLGGVAGDSSNELVGSLPGALVPGHEYLMQYSFDIGTPPGGDAGAAANGYLDFTITPGAPPDQVIPEPTSLAIFGFGALGLVAVGIRRRKRQTA
jgi:hypothetical protein